MFLNISKMLLLKKSESWDSAIVFIKTAILVRWN